MADRTGQQFGNYQLLNLLGRGGFADVYLGEHIHLGTKAAVKVLHTQLAGDDISGFRNEARTIAQLEHPHIVRVLDFGLEGTVPYLVMSYAPNGSLRQLYPRGTVLPLTTVVSHIKQIVEALQYAHDEKIIHRDIKPDNVLLGRHNELLLSDFGIALVAQSTKMQSIQEIIGTGAYMAPEMLQGHPRLASDQYALGIMAYEWICGDHPFRGTFLELASQHMFMPPPPLRSKNPAISPDVEQVVLMALAKEPTQRFASVKAFAHSLQQAAQTQAPGVQKLSSSQPASAQPPVQALSASQPALPPTVYIYTPPSSPTATSTSGRGVTRFTESHGQRTTGGFRGQQPMVVSPSQQSTMGTTLYTYTEHSDQVVAVAWSPNGERIASGSSDNTVQVWNASDGSDAFTYRGHSHIVSGIAWSPDGMYIASASTDNTVQVRNASDGSYDFTYQDHSDSVWVVAWSPDSKHIASGSSDKTVQVWNVDYESDVFTYQGHSNQVVALAWSPDGQRIASGGSDETVQVWNASDGSHLFSYRGHSDLVSAVAWSPDGKRIASASTDKTVQVWNASDGSHLFTYRGHFGFVEAVSWSPDSKRIASGSLDKTVQVWNASDGNGAFKYRGHSGDVHAVAWSPDGRRIASASTDKTVQVWEAV